MTPEEFLKELAGQLMPSFAQIHENLKTSNENFQIIEANLKALHRDMLVTHASIVELRETSQSHERRLGLLEEAPTGPIRKSTGTEGR